MTTLITGAGLIGRLTAEALAARGETVVCVDVMRAAALPGVTMEECDITDRRALRDVLDRHAVRRVIHTAAMLSTGLRADPLRGIEVNVMGTANLLEAARLSTLGRIVLASSSTVAYSTFGDPHPGGVPEDAALRLVSQRPGNIYAATKIANEHLALLYHDLYGVDVVALRFAAVLGSTGGVPTGVPGRLLARLAEAGASGAPYVLDDPFLAYAGREEFVDARDCARANLAALDAATPVQRVYNVAPGTWYSLDEVIATVRAVYPRLDVTLPHRPTTGFAGFRHLRPAPSSPDAAARELGFRCIHDLEDSVRHWSAQAASARG